MSITSITFVVFTFGVFALYYVIPRKFQWVLLLIASIVFYLFGGIQNAGYVLVTATTVYLAASAMQRLTEEQKRFIAENKTALSKEAKKAYRLKIKNKRKLYMIAALLLNIGILCFFKYFHFALEQINTVLILAGISPIQDTFHFIIPLGISFYTFQAIGYLLNVYWEKFDAEHNYFKFLLFVSFFPQITQGPISEYSQLSQELFTEHRFSYRNFAWGGQRIIWGFFKKIAVADTIAPWVEALFHSYSSYSGISVLFGAFFYSIQIYADFSGYMDIMCGYCEMLGITLTENFNCPYFSRSVAEYWRRWHISLGTWFKNYIYFPIGMSTWSRKLAKKTRAKFGKHFANTFPATIALLIVWTATGMWHGASWAYIFWGLLNGIFIIFAMWMEPVYEKCKNALHIKDESKAWKIFQVIRTFILVTFIKILPEVGTLSEGLGLWKQIFSNHDIPASLTQLLPFVNQYLYLGIVILGVILMFVFDLIRNRTSPREVFNRFPLVIREILLAGIIVLTLVFSAINVGGGFMYAQF